MGLNLLGALKPVLNPGLSIVDDSNSSNPLQSFLDPGNVFGGMLATMPAVPALPATPTLPVKYQVPFSPYKTNYGAFDTPIMQDVLSSLHPSVRYTPPPVAKPAPVSTGGGGGAPGGPTNDPIGPTTGQPPTSPSPPGSRNPPTTTPPPPGGPGKNPPVQPKVVAKPSAMQVYQRQYAQAPNSVITRSSMTVPGTAPVTQPTANPTAALGIKPGLLGGAAPAAGVAGAR